MKVEFSKIVRQKKKKKPKLRIHDLVRAADLRRTFSKSGSKDWSYRLFEITESFIDTIPIYHISVVDKSNSSQSEQLSDRYKEALLKQKKPVMKRKKI